VPTLTGVHLLPATGEFTYDTIAFSGQRPGASMAPLNTYYAPGGAKTDYSYAIDQLQAAHPECATVAVVCAWFCDGLTAGACRIFPATTYSGGAFERTAGGTDHWRVSSLTETSAGLVPIPTTAIGSYIYGGTPSDASIVRCLGDLKARGFRVVFYPFLLMTATGLPWRGLISYAPDNTSAATAAVTAFLGAAGPSDFTPDLVNLTVAYSGSPTDYTYQRMILHYANLCVVAGGVNVFVLGSELRGLETVRGPAWTKAGTTDSSGYAVWDYPFVAGLTQLAADVRSIFDTAGYTKSLSTLSNLVTYSADWSDWMGYQHAGANGQWPHLDSLYASANIDFVSFDNYLPLSDWTTANGGLDADYWQADPPATWPTPSPNTRGFGLSGAPNLYSASYLQANIEGGEKFDWYYNDGVNGGSGPDPNGSGLFVSVPQGDRAAQTRQTYTSGQQILGNKQLRWWWSNLHYALYDTGGGWIAQGPQTRWSPQSKPILFLEYGVPAVDKGTNQPNVFFASNSIESGTPYWSIWDPASGDALEPRRDDTISELALNTIYAYWQSNNATSSLGVTMIEWAFCCAWNWDARPFPTFPLLSDVWADASNWSAGNWLNGRGPATLPVAPSPPPTPSLYPTFPVVPTIGWSTRIRPRFATGVAPHVAGRESRRPGRALSFYDIELNYELLRSDAAHAELQTLAGFLCENAGAADAFWLPPPGLATVAGQPLGLGDGVTTNFPLLWSFSTYVEPVQATSGVTAVYLNGAPQFSGWSVSTGYFPAIQFASAPALGTTVSADFTTLWLCRMSDDYADFENFMTLFWSFRTVKLQTTRP